MVPLQHWICPTHLTDLVLACISVSQKLHLYLQARGVGGGLKKKQSTIFFLFYIQAKALFSLIFLLLESPFNTNFPENPFSSGKKILLDQDSKQHVNQYALCFIHPQLNAVHQHSSQSDMRNVRHILDLWGSLLMDNPVLLLDFSLLL